LAALSGRPLTLVVPKRPEIPLSVTAGLDTVAVRVPSHPVARALLIAARIPVAAPSANRSTEVSPTTGAHVEKSLGDAVDLILDAGPTLVGIESTVVDVTHDPPAVPAGIITREDLARVIGEIGRGGSLWIHARQPARGGADIGRSCVRCSLRNAPPTLRPGRPVLVDPR
jgi:tRNA threonylcarbamoyl adenosine modification protein (Sua5/YciO/YrdC/YwlC family)